MSKISTIAPLTASKFWGVERVVYWVNPTNTMFTPESELDPPAEEVWETSSQMDPEEVWETSAAIESKEGEGSIGVKRSFEEIAEEVLHESVVAGEVAVELADETVGEVMDVPGLAGQESAPRENPQSA